MISPPHDHISPGSFAALEWVCIAHIVEKISENVQRAQLHSQEIDGQHSVMVK